MKMQHTTPAAYTDPQKVKSLTRKVLWKLDLHVLPALALVCTRVLSILTTQSDANALNVDL